MNSVVSPQNNQTRQHNSNNPNAVYTSKSISVVGVPSVHISNNRLVVGSSSSSSTRSWTLLKVLGDGSFGTVWLCDWHGTLPPNTPLSPMQCGAGARPEWAGKRLVAVKRMKKRWEGGWDECQQLKELESLRAIPFHPNIIPLYDFFLMPATKELYFVFESMEGNLYHLIKARKGRPLAGGLVASIFFQIVSGLYHIHDNGYFHRDMKPENVLVTTTGLFDYTPLSPIASPNAPPEKDVVAIIKLADFGLARETKSKPPYTEYVSTRWYRAPEVLLLSRHYSNPVDMWALGTIMAELVNLRPLFPGSDQVDQIARICQVLGNPADDYGVDASGAPIGGGPWPKGLQMAQEVGFEFRRMPPQDIHSLFDRSVPTSLIHCIRDLLKFDPDARLTSEDCLHHRYLVESLPQNDIPLPPGVRLATPLPTNGHGINGLAPSISSLSPRSIPPSHSHTSQLQIPNVTASHRTSFFRSSATNGTAVPAPTGNDGDYPMPMDISPQTESPEYPLNGHSHVNGTTTHATDPSLSASQSQSTKFGKFSGISKKLGLGRFGSDKHATATQNHELPPVHDLGSNSTGSLKRLPSNGSDTRSLRNEPSSSSPRDTHLPARHEDLKRSTKKEAENNRKAAERLHLEAEKQRRALAEKTQREQARAVMQKRNYFIQQNSMKGSKGATTGMGKEIEWRKQPMGLGPIRTRTRDRDHHANGVTVSPRLHHPHPSHPPVAGVGIGVAGPNGSTSIHDSMDWRDSPSERSAKVRRMDLDDDGSSTDVHSTGRSSISRMSQLSQISAISFATVGTVDTDPGPSRPSRSRPGIRNRPSLLGLNRVSSTGTGSSSYRSSHTHSPSTPSARSSNSFNAPSLDGQLVHDFRNLASVDQDHLVTTTTTGESPPQSISPPPMQMLSLSSPSHSHQSSRAHSHPYSRSNPSLSPHPQTPSSPSLSPSPTPISPQSQYVTNTLQVPQASNQRAESLSSRRGQMPPPHLNVPQLQHRQRTPSLPPFATLEAVAGGGYEYPPLSPMSFTAPLEAEQSEQGNPVA
ncbi:kinase-like domain-containing protein [Lentinula raphanica]|nr:kinase-like domain-containing protein [Lentinula raphanica]